MRRFTYREFIVDFGHKERELACELGFFSPRDELMLAVNLGPF